MRGTIALADEWLKLDIQLKGVLAFFGVVIIVMVATAASLVTSGEMSATEFIWISLATVAMCTVMVFVLVWTGKVKDAFKQL